jgi:hypothetical protein
MPTWRRSRSQDSSGKAVGQGAAEREVKNLILAVSREGLLLNLRPEEVKVIRQEGPYSIGSATWLLLQQLLRPPSRTDHQRLWDLGSTKAMVVYPPVVPVEIIFSIPGTLAFALRIDVVCDHIVFNNG